MNKPKDLQHYKHADSKLRTMFQKASRYEINVTESDSYAHKACLLIRKTFFSKYLNNKLAFLQVPLSFGDIIKHRDDLEFEIPSADMCEKPAPSLPYEALSYDLFETLDEFMNEEKVIFLMFDIEDYSLDEDNEEEGPYIAHGTCGILVPTQGHYKMFYINSHGQDMKEANYYDIPITKRRNKHVKLDRPLDIAVLDSLVMKFNLRENSIRIEYNGDNKDTYSGINLQSGDGHGICFIIPYVIWYNLGRYYGTKRQIDDVMLGTVRHMLLSGDLNKFVHASFLEFSDTYKTLFLENIKDFAGKKRTINTLEGLVMKEGTRFVKKMGNMMIAFMTQAYFIRKINE